MYFLYQRENEQKCLCLKDKRHIQKARELCFLFLLFTRIFFKKFQIRKRHFCCVFLCSFYTSFNEFSAMSVERNEKSVERLLQSKTGPLFSLKLHYCRWFSGKPLFVCLSIICTCWNKFCLGKKQVVYLTPCLTRRIHRFLFSKTSAWYRYHLSKKRIAVGQVFVPLGMQSHAHQL